MRVGREGRWRLGGRCGAVRRAAGPAVRLAAAVLRRGEARARARAAPGVLAGPGCGWVPGAGLDACACRRIR